MCKFRRKEFSFHIPKEVEQCITNLENAVITEDSLLDCYLEELRAFCHFHTDGEDGMTEEEADEVIDYYYNTRSYMFDEKGNYL